MEVKENEKGGNEKYTNWSKALVESDGFLCLQKGVLKEVSETIDGMSETLKAGLNTGERSHYNHHYHTYNR